ncbi:hypothetical protein [Aliiroseovarius sp. 2305UL8-7]|uniref:hypothetical protein n=1 Tax=Aliiroseovarius conchicola TaxID=3121637 RepID=UPI003528F4CE
MTEVTNRFAKEFVSWAQSVKGRESSFVRNGSLYVAGFMKDANWPASTGRQRFKDNKQLQKVRAKWEEMHCDLDEKPIKMLPDVVPSRELKEAQKRIAFLERVLALKNARIKQLEQHNEQHSEVRELIALGGRYQLKWALL